MFITPAYKNPQEIKIISFKVVIYSGTVMHYFLACPCLSDFPHENTLPLLDRKSEYPSPASICIIISFIYASFNYFSLLGNF